MSATAILIGATVFALAGTLACSLFESVLLSLPGDHVEAMARQGHAWGRILRRLRADIQRPIAAILVLNTLATSGAGAVAGAMVAEIWGAAWVMAFSLLFCFLLLIVSEVLPKTAGVVHSRALAPLVARPLAGLVWVLGPIVRVIRLLTDRFGVRHGSEHTVTAEELVVMARLGHQHGVIDDQEAEVIENIIGLSRSTVVDVLQALVDTPCVDADVSVATAARMPEVLGASRLLLRDATDQSVTGVVMRRHVLGEAAADRGTRAVRELMRPAISVGVDEPLDRVLKRFIETRQYLFLVMDRNGQALGVITLESILERILGRALSDETHRATT